MGTISWIEDTANLLEGMDLDSLVNRREAVRIVREKDLWMPDPSERVYAFVSALPSLFEWFVNNYRDFMWRRTRDPWEVLTAEILLQRTHADQVAEMYDSFIERFPEPASVYTADREEVFDSVEMVGFGNRKMRTLKALAESIVEDHDGKVPDDLATLQKLPRIGPYTARACLCFAYGRPLALVDANVATVVQHAFGYISRRRAHKDPALYAFLDALIPKQPDLARVFNLALLDLRESICVNTGRGLRCPLGGACLYARPEKN